MSGGSTGADAMRERNERARVARHGRMAAMREFLLGCVSASAMVLALRADEAIRRREALDDLARFSRAG